MNFKNTDSFSQEQYLAGDQGKIVFMESTDDVFIIKKWFSRLLDKIQFESVSGKKENGGCKQVISKVNEEDHYYGIVDRDALLNHINNHESTWWETDDHLFYAEKPFGEKVFVLNRWEMENYLLNPAAIAQRIENHTMGALQLSASDLAEKIIAEIDNLIAVTVLASLGRGDRKDQYAMQDSGAALWKKVTTDVGSRSAEISDHKQKVNDFAEHKTDSLERWERLSRMLDGKRVMYRIDGMLHNENEISSSFCLQGERGNLADDIFNQNLVDEELENWLVSIH